MPPQIKHSTPWSRLLLSGIVSLGLLNSNSIQAANALPEISSAASITLNPQQEYELGQQILSQIRAGLPLIDDILINHYLNSLGSRLVTAADDSSFPFTFLVIDAPQINAFATPGGVIVVHSGLILAAQDESELAAVLAHEIAHVTQRHIARMYSEAGGQNFAAILGMIAAALLASHSAAAAQASLYTGLAASADAQLSFSRDNEQEADRAGQDILDQAGYDTSAMNRFFKKLLDSTLIDADQTAEFLQTHPLPQSRISDTWQLNASQSDGIRDSDSFQFFKARVARIAKTGGTTTQLSSRDAGHYANALKLFQNKQADAAMQQLNLIQSPQNRYEGLLRAQIGMLQRQDSQSESLLRRLNKQYPSDPAILQQLCASLLAQSKEQEVIRLLRPYNLKDFSWLPLLPLRAKAEALSGRQINSHESMASYYTEQGRITLALEQIQLALKLAPQDSIAQARLEVQEKNLREQIRKNQPPS